MVYVLLHNNETVMTHEHMFICIYWAVDMSGDMLSIYPPCMIGTGVTVILIGGHK